jgi:hypothetical protein
MNVAIPDYVEPLQGWRVWRFEGERARIRLLSLVKDVVWPARQELVADCLRRRLLRLRGRPHPAPCEECACGIYATSFDQVATLLDDVAWRGIQSVFGRVLIWGTVIECEHGWRASRAYPAELFVPTRHALAPVALAEEIAHGLRRYGVPVRVLPCGPREALEEVARGGDQLGLV